jgi:acyl dehydratase
MEVGSMADEVLYFEDVAEGDEAPIRSHVLDRTDLVRYAGASGDFNPMHHDEVKAVQAGQPSVFGHGMFSMGFLGSALTDYVGVGNVRRFQVRFAKQTWPDEKLSTKIVVTGKRSEGDDHLVDLDVRLHNGDGEEKVVGEATAVVPSRP